MLNICLVNRESNSTATDPKDVVADGKAPELGRPRSVGGKLLGDDRDVRELSVVSGTTGVAAHEVKSIRVQVDSRLVSGNTLGVVVRLDKVEEVSILLIKAPGVLVGKSEVVKSSSPGNVCTSTLSGSR